jgi:large subunit ribosomal protein L25
MVDFKLKATEKTEKPNKLRREGKLPAVVYGRKFEALPIALDSLEFQRVAKDAGTSNLIELSVNNSKFKVLINEIQIDPISGANIHADLLKVNMKEKIHAEIPLEFIGTSPAVLDLEGSLITPVDSIEVECLPGDLMSEIKVDISVLDDFEKNLKVSDLSLPEGIEILSDPEEVIAFVQEPRSEEEIEALDEEVVENVEAIEVENKGEEVPAEAGKEESAEGKTE